jgi:polyisoprenoid-binding protein YceI
MTNRIFLALGLVGLAALVLIGGGAWAYNALLGEAATPSSPITAIPVAVNTVAAPTPTAAPAVVADSPTATSAEVSVEPTAETGAPASGPVVFEISPEQSEVSFSIYEELGGQPKTVIGVSNQVAGQIALDLSDLSRSQVGVIQVNARTFVTDSDRRNNAIRNFILQTNQYEFITFTPTAITGLSGAAQPGQPFTFEISGDLTIRNVAQPVVFTVTAQGDSPTRLTGTATAVVQRGPFNLTIPSVPNVANVGEEVTLEIKFVAEATS